MADDVPLLPQQIAGPPPVEEGDGPGSQLLALSSIEPRERERGQQMRRLYEERLRADVSEETPLTAGLRTIPLVERGFEAGRTLRYTQAMRRYQAGTPEDEDYRLIAEHERLHQIDEERPFEASLFREGLRFGTETYAGGQLFGPALGRLGGAATEAGTAAAMRAAAGQAARGPLARAGAFAGQAALTQAGMPSLWGVPEAMEENLQRGRDTFDPRGLATHYAQGYVNAAVLGTLSRIPGQIPGRNIGAFLARTAARTGAGVVEQGIADVLAGAAGLQSDFGTLGELWAGRTDAALERASRQAAMFSLFGALHEYQHGAPERPDPHLRAFTDAVRDLRRQGLSAREIGRRFDQVQSRFQEAMRDDPTLGRVEARRLAADISPPGPLRMYATELAETRPWEGFYGPGRPPTAAPGAAAPAPEGLGPVLTPEERQRLAGATPEQRAAGHIVTEGIEGGPGTTVYSPRDFEFAGRMSQPQFRVRAEGDIAAKQEEILRRVEADRPVSSVNLEEVRRATAAPEPFSHATPEEIAEIARSLRLKNIRTPEQLVTAMRQAGLSPETIQGFSDRHRAQQGRPAGQPPQRAATYEGAPEQHPAPVPSLTQADRLSRLTQAPGGRQRAETVVRSVFPDAKVTGPGTFDATIGDRLVQIAHDPARNALSIDFEKPRVEGERPRVQLAIGPELQAGSVNLMHALRELAKGAADAGMGITYNTDPRRARVYARGLKAAGFELAGEEKMTPTVSQYTWRRTRATETVSDGRGRTMETPVDQEPIHERSLPQAEQSLREAVGAERAGAPRAAGEPPSVRPLEPDSVRQSAEIFADTLENEGVPRGLAREAGRRSAEVIRQAAGGAEVPSAAAGGGAPGGHELTQGERHELRTALREAGQPIEAAEDHIRALERAAQAEVAAEAGLTPAEVVARTQGEQRPAEPGRGGPIQVTASGLPGPVAGRGAGLTGPGPGAEPGGPAPGPGAGPTPGFGAPVTAEERARGLFGGGQPIAGGEAGEGPIAMRLREHALADAQIDAQRQREGKPALMSQAQQSDPAVWQEAMQRLAADPQATNQLVAQLSRRPRPTTPVESMLLLHRQIALRNELERTHLEYLAHMRNKTGTAFELNALEGRVDALEAERDRLDRAVRDAGSEAGRAFRIRRVLMQEDYSFTGLLQRLQVARERAGQGSVPPEERQALYERAEAIFRAHAEQARAEEALAQEANRIIAERNNGRVTPAAQTDAIVAGAEKAPRGMAGRLVDWVRRLFSREEGWLPLPSSAAVQIMRSPQYADMIRARLETARSQAATEAAIAAYEPKPLGRRVADGIIKLQQNFVISGLKTLGKLPAASLQRFVQYPLEQAAGAVLSRLPGIGKLFALSPRYGRGLHPEVEIEAAWRGITDGVKDGWARMRTGQSPLDVMQEGVVAREWSDLQFGVHGGLKAPAVRNEYTRSFLERLDNHIAQGRQVTQADLLRIQGEAFRDANAAEFKEQNWLVEGWQRWLANQRASQSPVANVVGFAGKIAVPIVRIPTNLAFQIGEHIFGLPYGGIKAVRAWQKGLENLKPQEADHIARLLSRGLLGSAALLLGALNPQHFGGYYSGRRREEDLQAGQARLFGVTVPSWAMHNPLVEMMQLGATIRRASDHAGGDLGHGIAEGLRGWVEEIPLVREATRELPRAVSPNPRERGRFFGELAKTFVVPQFLQWLAREQDVTPEGRPIPRRPQTVLENIQTGIPGLRQQVPGQTPRPR